MEISLPYVFKISSKNEKKHDLGVRNAMRKPRQIGHHPVPLRHGHKIELSSLEGKHTWPSGWKMFSAASDSANLPSMIRK